MLLFCVAPNWTQATSNADWAAREGHTAVVFDNKMWILGGSDGSNKNDVWYTNDGINWSLATSNASWTGRSHLRSVVSDNKILILGGSTGLYKNDVWYSSNGSSWIENASSTDWPGRFAHASVQFNNKIWVLGGYTSSGAKNDIWYMNESWQGTQQVGTSGDDIAYGIAIGSDGGIFITGETGGSLNGENYTGGKDAFLMKFGSSGVHQWTKQFGTSSDDFGSAIVLDSAGNIYITGQTQGELDGNSNTGGHDVFLTKYNSSGTKLWTKLWGSISDDWSGAITVDNAGYIFITGTIAPHGSNIMFFAKYNSSGVFQWDKQWNNSSQGNGISVDSSGNIYIAGHTHTATVWDQYLAKFDSSGTLLWAKPTSNAGYDYGHGIVQDSAGHIYVPGSTTGSIGGNTNLGSNDIILVKYDTDGNIQWAKQPGTVGEDWVTIGGISLDSSGNICITGLVTGILDGNSFAGSKDVFLIKYNSSGTKLWSKQIGTSSDDIGNSVAVDDNGNAFIVGETQGGLDGNSNAGQKDIFLLKYDSNGIKQ
ncbi:MAG: hypothetical protein HOC09_37110 [Deltaproteobacteria bacterium]|nr:hypothetical protein [Deltaproteobacteria bacterium]